MVIDASCTTPHPAHLSHHRPSLKTLTPATDHTTTNTPNHPRAPGCLPACPPLPISPQVDINNQEDSGSDPDELEEGGEEDALPPVVFSVNITKEEQMMTFSCEADGSGITIRHVSLADAADLEEDEDDEEGMGYPPYTGPVFEELDDTLQQAFADYLEERGITAEFGLYLMELLHDKLEVEYMNWLQRARDFVSS